MSKNLTQCVFKNLQFFKHSYIQLFWLSFQSLPTFLFFQYEKVLILPCSTVITLVFDILLKTDLSFLQYSTIVLRFLATHILRVTSVRDGKLAENARQIELLFGNPGRFPF